MSMSIFLRPTRQAIQLTARRPAVRRAARPVITAMCAAALAACSDLTAPQAPPLDASDLAANASQSTATTIQFGDFALHVPANVNRVRGILLAIGGPDTRGFADPSVSFGAPQAVTPPLQELGAMFRDLAAERGLAILGSARSRRSPYPNEPASDQQLLNGIAQAANLTGRAELLKAPLLVYGISGGGPEAAGFTQRNPERVAALFLKVPQRAGPLTGEALRVPAYMVLAELDAFSDNSMLTATFEAHRAAGAPWAMAMEPGVPHHSLSPAQRELTIAWMRAILPLGAAGPFRQTSPKVGWLGDPETGQITPASSFSGNRSTASWFPTRPLAVQWAKFIGL